jgi:hypothetical protein
MNQFTFQLLEGRQGVTKGTKLNGGPPFSSVPFVLFGEKLRAAPPL